MQGGWARRQGRDLRADGGGAGRRSRGVGQSISTTHNVVDKHADNCVNASTSASTNTVKNASTSSAIVEQNNNGIHSARAKAGAATTIPEARRRPAASPVITALAPPASPSPQGGWHARTSATATAITTKTKSKGQRHDDDCRGQEEAGCVERGRHPRPARLAVAMGAMARKDIGDGNNNKDKNGDKDGNGNKDDVTTETTTRQQRGQRQRRLRRRRIRHPRRMTWVDRQNSCRYLY